MGPRTENRVVLFCDCHDFSKLQAALGDRAFDFINDFYRSCGECLVANGGRIIKYIGDAILATFPAEAAQAAVAAGRCMRREYADLVAAQGTGVDSEIEVGISWGEVMEGTIGHESLRSFDVFGECVNEAAIIGHHRGIAVTDDLKQRLSPETRARQLDSYRPKWRTDPLVVWEIVEG